MKKNLIVGQSGGPTAVINGSLYGVISEGLEKNDSIGEIYGMVNGIEGFLNDQVIPLRSLQDSDELSLIRTTPGAYLGSCRFKLPEDLDDAVYQKLFRKFEKYGIGYFFYIGGNDSMDTVSKLSRYASSHKSDIRFIGLPKTVDNDLCLTDHTPGFASAAKFVATVIREVSIDASVYSNKKSVTIVEIMGRHAGWLTAASVLARTESDPNPLLVYLPEVAFDQDAFLKQVQDSFKTINNLIVCISEGIHDNKGTFICEYDSSVGVDNFGHKMLAGSGKYLENLISSKLGIKVRSIELNVPQRCSSSCLSATDLGEAVSSGRAGVRFALDGMTGKMVAFERTSSEPYTISYVPVDVDAVCNLEKAVPAEWIIKDGTDVSDEFIKYAKPLIQGFVDIPKEDGLPKFAYRR